jgi:hypothetical protein
MATKTPASVMPVTQPCVRAPGVASDGAIRGGVLAPMIPFFADSVTRFFCRSTSITLHAQRVLPTDCGTRAEQQVAIMCCAAAHAHAAHA